jgi:hypothetical protein
MADAVEPARRHVRVHGKEMACVASGARRLLRKGNRPSFIRAAPHDLALPL